MTDHPAKFSSEILELLELLVGSAIRQVGGPLLDPMAGLGRLAELGYPTILGELQYRWAAACPPPAYVADAACLPFRANSIGVVATSPTYANRMSDRYAGDGTARYTYTISHGSPLHPENTGGMQWGREYRAKNAQILWDIYRVLRPEGRLILNVKDHYRHWRKQNVTGWWLVKSMETGFEVLNAFKVPTPGMRNGANHGLRATHELVFVLRKPAEDIVEHAQPTAAARRRRQLPGSGASTRPKPARPLQG